MQIKNTVITAVLALGLAGAAFAQQGLPQERSFGGVSYITGGIGLDESAAIKAAEKNFTLSLTFAATKRGEYLSDVKLSIKDKLGKTVLDAVSAGPMLLAKLPAGTYKITAEHQRKSLTKTVQVGAAGVTRAAFVWKPKGKATTE